MLISKKATLAAIALSAAGLAAATPALAAPAATTSRVSLEADGGQLEFGAYDGTISGNGKFAAYIANRGEPTSGVGELVVRNLATGAIKFADHGRHGELADGFSFGASLSQNGRYVTFASYGSNLVAGDTNNTADIFVRDTKTNVIKRVSVASDGAQSNGYSDEPKLSADGRFVVFFSDGTNLVPGGTAAWDRHAYVHELATGKTTLVTVGLDGTPAKQNTGGVIGDSYEADISADGRYVTFMSSYSDLVVGDTNDGVDVFVRDLVTGKTALVSAGKDGHSANGYTTSPSITRNGRLVAFASTATNLVTPKGGDRQDVYVRNVVTGKTERVSIGPDGKPLKGSNGDAQISSNGRFIVFRNLPDRGSDAKLYLRDRTLKTTRVISVNQAGQPATGGAYAPFISDDGARIVFTSAAADLVDGDTNTVSDVFIRKLR